MCSPPSCETDSCAYVNWSRQKYRPESRPPTSQLFQRHTCDVGPPLLRSRHMGVPGRLARVRSPISKLAHYSLSAGGAPAASAVPARRTRALGGNR